MKFLVTIIMLTLACICAVIGCTAHQASLEKPVAKEFHKWPPVAPECKGLEDWDFVDCVTNKVPQQKDPG